MIIYGFDCGIKNMGICCIEFIPNIKQSNKLNINKLDINKLDINKLDIKILKEIYNLQLNNQKIINKLNNKLTNKLADKLNIQLDDKLAINKLVNKLINKLNDKLDELIINYKLILKLIDKLILKLNDKLFTKLNDKLNDLYNNFKILFVNTIDLCEDKADFQVALARLKYVLYCLDKQLPKPDYVLVEKQLYAREISISTYIISHYTNISKHNIKNISYSLKYFPINYLQDYELPDQYKTNVILVNPVLKNTVQIDSEITGNYSSFISKYSTNRTANKKHTDHNFLYYLEKTNQLHIIDGNKKKLNDVSDAFMMIYAWILKKSSFN
jgi:hypothetical protein